MTKKGKTSKKSGTKTNARTQKLVSNRTINTTFLPITDNLLPVAVNIEKQIVVAGGENNAISTDNQGHYSGNMLTPTFYPPDEITRLLKVIEEKDIELAQVRSLLHHYKTTISSIKIYLTTLRHLDDETTI